MDVAGRCLLWVGSNFPLQSKISVNITAVLLQYSGHYANYVHSSKERSL